MRSPLAYRPHAGPLQLAGAAPALAYLGALALVAFLFSNPLVLASAGLAVVLAGLASGARRALWASGRFALGLGVAIVLVNGLVTQRGDTILVRGGEAPLLGRLDVTLEALAAGGVVAMRIVVVAAACAVAGACVNPDRVLAILRPLARHSVLTATLIARLVPVAAADHARIREASLLRGPAAAPVGRAAIARRVVAGALDRSLDAAATLELRGYALPGGGSPPRRGPRTPRAPAFVLAAAALAVVAVGARIAGVAGFDPYPSLALDADPATLALCALILALAMAPLAGARRRNARSRRRAARPPRGLSHA